MPFEIVRNDITRMKADAIVNAANPSLLGGGGVDGAIHLAAGPELLEECRRLGGCETGQAKITGGYRLPAKYVIHTVGPVWHGGNNGERELLMSCYRSSLALTLANGCTSVAFPLISAGAYGYPKDLAMDAAVDAIRAFLSENDMWVILVLFGHTEFLTGKKLFREVREYIDDVYARSRVRKNVERQREHLWRTDEKAALDMDMALSEDAAAFPMVPDGPADATAAPGGAPEHRPFRTVTAAKSTVSNAGPDWEEMLRGADEGFSQALLRLIDRKGMTDAQCYRRANVDRKLFSKIRSNPGYRPSKPTVFAFAVALRLDLGETRELLEKAGFALSRSSGFDIILEYFIKTRNYDIFEINQVLFQFDMPLLGSGAN